MVDIVPILAPNTLFTADFLTVNYRVDQSYLEARWWRPVSSSEFRQGIETATEIIHCYGVELMLIDIRQAGIPSASDQGWLVKHLSASKCNTPLRRSASLQCLDILQSLVSELVYKRAGAFPFEYQDFCCERLALEWLFLKGDSEGQ